MTDSALADYFRAITVTPAERASAQIAQYLLTGMHHSTPEAQSVMRDIITVAMLQDRRESTLISGMVDRLNNLTCPHCHERIGTTFEV